MTFTEFLDDVRRRCGPRPTESAVVRYGNVFTHYDPADGTQRDFAVGLMNIHQSVLEQEIVCIEPDPKFAHWMVGERGVEGHRVTRLLNTPAIDFDPVLFAHWPDGTHLLIDGTHRYVAACVQGAKSLRARILPEVIWKPFIIVGHPQIARETLLSSFSNIH